MQLNSFVKYYHTAKMVFFDRVIPLPREDSQSYGDLAFLLQLLEGIGADPLEYLMVQVKHYKRRNKFPKTEELLEKRAFARYRRYKHLKNRLEAM